MSKVYTGDTGTVISLDCGADISAATDRKILARKPSGTEVEWAASASGTDGVQYTTQADTFDQAGTWMLQAKVTTATGTWRGETATLQVYAPWA